MTSLPGPSGTRPSLVRGSGNQRLVADDCGGQRVPWRCFKADDALFQSGGSDIGARFTAALPDPGVVTRLSGLGHREIATCARGVVTPDLDRVDDGNGPASMHHDTH
jgi:hypothetical protein